jgi:hypothetical protein
MRLSIVVSRSLQEDTHHVEPLPTFFEKRPHSVPEKVG